MSISQTITDFSEAPQKLTDSATVFDTKADTRMTEENRLTGEINTWANQANTLATDVNTDATQVATDRAQVENLTSVNQSIANFAGNWSDLSGAKNVPLSTLHNDKYYQLLVNIADVTAVEPGVTAGWENTWDELLVIPSVSGQSGKFITNDGTELLWDNVGAKGATLSGATIFKTATMESIAAVRISATETLYAYRDTGDSNKGKAKVITWGETLSVSNEAEFAAASVNYISGCLYDSTHMFLSFSGTDTDGYASMLSWTGGTLSVVDKEFEWADAETINTTNGCVTLPNSKVAIFYRHNASSDLYAKVLAWSGTNLSNSYGPTSINAGTIPTGTLIDAKVSKTSGNTANIIVTSQINSAGVDVDFVYWDDATMTPVNSVGIQRSKCYFGYVNILSENSFVVFTMNQDNSSLYTTPTMYLFYHAGGAADNIVLKQIYLAEAPLPIQFYSHANPAKSYATSFNTSEVAILYEYGSNNLLLQSFDMSIGANTSDITISKTIEQYIPRQASLVSISQAGADQLFLGFKDAENSDYGVVEKVEI